MSHKFTTKRPMPSAWSAHIYGPVRPMKDNGHGFDHLPIWGEQPRIGRAFLAIATLIAAAGGLVVAFS